MPTQQMLQLMMLMMMMAVDEDAGDEDDDNDDDDEFKTMTSMMERLKVKINIQNMHVTKMILMCSMPGAEEDKKHNNVMSNHPCLSEREHHTPFKSHITEVYHYR